MVFNEIKLSDKILFNYYLNGRRHDLIAYCFSNFYLWRNWDHYTWAEVKDALVLKSGNNGQDMILVPISPDDQAVLNATETMIEWYKSKNRVFIISEASSTDLAMYEKYWPGRFSAMAYPAGANYIYLQKDLAELKGGKYDAKRNHIHRFMRYYPNHRLLPLTDDLIAECKEQLARWNSCHNMQRFDLEQEYLGIIDALDNLSELDCQGAALLIGDKVVGFTIGEPLNSDTYCIHIEKGNTDIVGIYQAINCFYAREYACGYTYINRAEDMGEKGLCRAKSSYCPCRMEKIYYLRLNNGKHSSCKFNR